MEESSDHHEKTYTDEYYDFNEPVARGMRESRSPIAHQVHQEVKETKSPSMM